MKRILSVILAAVVLTVSLTGCSGVSQEEYDAVVERCSQLEADNKTLSDQNKALQSENDALAYKNQTLSTKAENATRNYYSLESNYKQIVESEEYQNFIALSENEQAAEIARAEKERIEAEEAARLAQEEASRQEAERLAQEEAERLAEEAKGYETGITFEQLSRTPDDYVNAKVKFTGSVLQVLENSGVNEIRMSTNGKYDDVIYGSYLTDILDVRLLQDDIITIYGEFKGLITYETIMGGSVTLPYVLIDRIELTTTY